MGGTSGSTTWSATWLDGTAGVPEETYTIKCVARGAPCSTTPVGQAIAGIVRGVQAGQVTGLPPSTALSCFTVAVNTISAVCSAPYNITTTQAPADNKAPGPPTNVVNTATGTTWNAAWLDGTQGTPTETYTARCVAPGGACSAPSSHEVSVQRGVQKADVTGLTAGAWTCFVVSTNSVGSSCSGPVTVNINSNVAPGAPTKVGGTTVATGQWLATWTDGSAGVPTETYSVKCVASGQPCTATAIGVGGTNIPRGVQSGQVNGLTAGSASTCYVIAGNSVNQNVCSDGFAVNVPANATNAPGAPVILASVPSNTTSGVWLVTWSPGTQGNPAETYSTKCVLSGGSCQDAAQGSGQSNLPRTTTSGQVSGLVGASTYSCYVVASNSVGTNCSNAALFSNSGSISPGAGILPGIPIPNPPNVGSTNVAISFTPGTPGVPSETYQISCYSAGSPCPTVNPPIGISVFTLRSSPSGIVQGLTAQTGYTCYVIAQNNAGRQCSTPIPIVTTNGVQQEGTQTPPRFLLPVPTADLTDVSWLALWSNGVPIGNPLATYTISCYLSAGAPNTCPSFPIINAPPVAVQATVPTPGATSFLVTGGFSPGTQYTCFMYGFDAQWGYTTCSNAATFTTLQLPSAPTLTGAATATATSWTAQWTPPTTIGIPAASYIVRCFDSVAFPAPTCTTPGPSVSQTSGVGTTSTVLTLTPNTNYNCFVAAANTLGEGGCSASFAVSTPPLAPSTPVWTIPINQPTTVTWSAQWSRGIPLGVPAESFIINCYDPTLTPTPNCQVDVPVVSTTAAAGATSKTLTGLTQSTTYTCFIYGTNEATPGGGISACSTGVTVTTATPPGAPSGVAATLVSGRIYSISWTLGTAALPNTESYQAQCSVSPVSCGGAAVASSVPITRPASGTTASVNIDLTNLGAVGTVVNCWVITYVPPGLNPSEIVCSTDIAPITL